MTLTAQRCFQLAWPPWQPPAVDGVVALVDADAACGWADSLLARHGDGFLKWAATGDRPAQQAMATRELPGVRAVVLAPTCADVRAAAVALDVALHLAQERANGHGPRRCVVSPTRPTPPAGVVRVPHLISLRKSGVVTDTVIWEVMSHAEAAAWLGAPIRDQRLTETHLGELLALRAAARVGRLPATGATAELLRLLHGRDLSIELVYQHPELFHVLLAGRRGQP